MRLSRAVAVVLVGLAACGPARDPDLPGAAARYESWATYGGNHEQNRYSSLTQINRTNVSQLAVAWTYDTGETGAMQTQPIVVDDVLYACTPRHKTFALRAATGEHLWTFDPDMVAAGPNRGLMYWADGADRRVFAPAGTFVYALNAATGRPIASFGTNGRIDLLTEDFAIEVDFIQKWHEGIGQALHYASATGKRPALALVRTS